MDFQEHIQYVIKAHRDFPKEPRNAFRRWDLKTPYSMHPIWCATTIFTETSLPQETRDDGSLALLYHDILEDTTAKLPECLPKKVAYLIDEMTFHGGSAQEMIEIWGKESVVKLLKVYDKTSNLLDGVWMPPEKLEVYRNYTRRLADDIESNYGELNIVRIARVITRGR